MLKSIGPRIDPCGAPYLIKWYSLKELFIFDSLVSCLPFVSCLLFVNSRHERVDQDM